MSYGSIDEPLWDKSSGEDFKSLNIKERHVFIQKIYTILMMMLTMTISTCVIFRTVDSVNHWVMNNAMELYVPCIVFAFVIEIMILCIPACRYDSPLNYLCLGFFTLCFSVLMGVITVHYETNIVLLAFSATAFIVVSLTLFAFQTKYDFTGLAPYLFIFLMGLIFLGFIQIWFHNQVMNTVVASFGAIIFSFYLVMDTQMIVGGDHKLSIGPDEYIIGALMLYLDIINLFLYILQLFSNNK